MSHGNQKKTFADGPHLGSLRAGPSPEEQESRARDICVRSWLRQADTLSVFKITRCFQPQHPSRLPRANEMKACVSAPSTAQGVRIWETTWCCSEGPKRHRARDGVASLSETHCWPRGGEAPAVQGAAVLQGRMRPFSQSTRGSGGADTLPPREVPEKPQESGCGPRGGSVWGATVNARQGQRRSHAWAVRGGTQCFAFPCARRHGEVVGRSQTCVILW